MRGWSRVALVVIVFIGIAAPLSSQTQGDCPLTLVGSNLGANDFSTSPHGVFRAGNQVYVLRGQTLTTYTVNEVGDLTIAREDFIGSLAARDERGGVLFHNGHLFVSSEAGLEIFNLVNVRPGGSAPALVARVPNLYYRRLAASGNTLAGLYPGSSLPCAPSSNICGTRVDLIDITTLSNPRVVGSLRSDAITLFRNFEEIAFNQGFLFTAGEGGLFGFNVSNPGAVTNISGVTGRVTFMSSNGMNLIAIGDEDQIELWNVNLAGGLTRVGIFVLPFGEMIDRANPIMFHPQVYIDEPNARLITMIDELDPHTLQPARTIAFDVFDYGVLMYEGSFPRVYENISYVTPDEVKYNPTVVGSNVYVIGEVSGLQAYGACGVATGRFDWNGLSAVNCGGFNLSGWVTGTNRIANIEVSLYSLASGTTTNLGNAVLSGPPRTDIPSRTPVTTFRIPVNFDNVAAGEYILRAVATDALGTRRQFAGQRVVFNGPGRNCTTRRRSAGF